MKQTLIEPGYEGVCDKCKTMFCPNYGYCVDDGGKAKCVCPDKCENVMMIEKELAIISL